MQWDHGFHKLNHCYADNITTITCNRIKGPNHFRIPENQVSKNQHMYLYPTSQINSNQNKTSSDNQSQKTFIRTPSLCTKGARQKTLSRESRLSVVSHTSSHVSTKHGIRHTSRKTLVKSVKNNLRRLQT
ncbi:unnamed protein product [Vicia faba]|uniref:Uncharacterized protein n=1 Tax=Vicia faba TaxID=3906 RepID=A0AAV0ZL32_VICFA|nr:unnamed protein product [Vicia faba]